MRSASLLDVTVEHLPTVAKTAAMIAGYDQSFASYAVVYAISATCWLAINASKPIVA